MAGAGALSAISLGISIENITFIIALIAFCILYGQYAAIPRQDRDQNLTGSVF